MSSTVSSNRVNERQPLNEEHDPNDPNVSFIPSDHSPLDHNRNGYYTDPVFAVVENPYRDTTESDINLRHMPLSEIIPRPWRSYRQIEIASYISVVIFLLTGVFAVKYTWRGRMHQTKGLMGMAQRDLQLAARLIYASVLCGILLYFIIIPVAAS